MNIKHLDWNDYHSYIDKLAKKITAKSQAGKCPKYKYVAGVEIDDMLVAVHLSHKLKIRVIIDINLLSLLLNITDRSEEVLVVSNIVDTGNTFKNIMNQMDCSFDTAALFKDKESKFKPTHHVEIPISHVYFPWEQCGIVL